MKAQTCLTCRSTFTDAEISGKSACPKCGNKGVPGDLNRSASVTLTHQEWRILFMWSTNYAESIKATDQPGLNSPGVVAAIAGEAKRQAPDLPPLSLREEIQQVANAFPDSKLELHQSGEVEVIKPERKN